MSGTPTAWWRPPGRVSVGLAVGGLAAVVLIVFAHPLLNLLGDEYADSSTGALRLLAAGVVPYAVLQAYNSVCRVRGRYTEAIVIGVALGTALCVSAMLAAESGPTAMALTWLVVLAIGSTAIGLRLVAVLRRVTKDAR